MRIYCSCPITGRQLSDVFAYYERVRSDLSALGYEVMTPLVAKDFLRTAGIARSSGHVEPVARDQAILRRDHWMVSRADVVYVNFLGASCVSVGCSMELAWGYHLAKHTVLAMEEDNCHRHGFVLTAADVRFESEVEAVDYLGKLIAGSF